MVPDDGLKERGRTRQRKVGEQKVGWTDLPGASWFAFVSSSVCSFSKTNMSKQSTTFSRPKAPLFVALILTATAITPSTARPVFDNSTHYDVWACSFTDDTYSFSSSRTHCIPLQWNTCTHINTSIKGYPNVNIYGKVSFNNKTQERPDVMAGVETCDKTKATMYVSLNSVPRNKPFSRPMTVVGINVPLFVVYVALYDFDVGCPKCDFAELKDEHKWPKKG
eukprot:m.93805 g.93805  ORF g.93805 m.93805 type:complete len:222 (+) comp21810_c0_seq2:59-724(+)